MTKLRLTVRTLWTVLAIIIALSVVTAAVVITLSNVIIWHNPTTNPSAPILHQRASDVPLINPQLPINGGVATGQQYEFGVQMNTSTDYASANLKFKVVNTGGAIDTTSVAINYWVLNSDPMNYYRPIVLSNETGYVDGTMFIGDIGPPGDYIWNFEIQYNVAGDYSLSIWVEASN